MYRRSRNAWNVKARMMGATLRMGATLSILSIVAFGLRFGRHLQHSKDCLGPVADTLLCLLRVAPIITRRGYIAMFAKGGTYHKISWSARNNA